MPTIGKGLKVIHNPDGTSKMFVGEDEFPYFTKRESLKVEPLMVEDTDEPVGGLHWVTVAFLVDGDVEL